MADKRLKRLSRKELLEMLIAMEKENTNLREQLDDAERRLENRKIDLEQSGTLAEAALRLNGVFEAADAAAKQYLENIRRKEEGISLQELGIEN